MKHKRVHTLIAALEDIYLDDSSRLDVIRTLGELGADATAAIPALIRSQDHPDITVSTAASRAIQSIGEPGLPFLLSFLKDSGEEDKLRFYAADEVGNLGQPGIPVLLGAMRDADSTVRAAAIMALPRAGPEAARGVPELSDLMVDPGWANIAAIALACIAKTSLHPDQSPAFSALEQAMKSKDPRIRRIVVSALEYLGEKGDVAVLLLREAVQDQSGEVRDEARRVLDKIGRGDG